MTFRIGKSETDIDFVVTKKEHLRFIRNVKAIAGEFQHALVLANMDESKTRKVVRWTCVERRKVTLPKDLKIRYRFE